MRVTGLQGDEGSCASVVHCRRHRDRPRSGNYVPGGSLHRQRLVARSDRPTQVAPVRFEGPTPRDGGRTRQGRKRMRVARRNHRYRFCPNPADADGRSTEDVASSVHLVGAAAPDLATSSSWSGQYARWKCCSSRRHCRPRRPVARHPENPRRMLRTLAYPLQGVVVRSCLHPAQTGECGPEACRECCEPQGDSGPCRANLDPAYAADGRRNCAHHPVAKGALAQRGGLDAACRSFDGSQRSPKTRRCNQPNEQQSYKAELHRHHRNWEEPACTVSRFFNPKCRGSVGVEYYPRLWRRREMGVEITAQRSTLLRRSRPSRYQRDRHTLQRKRLSANSA